MSNDFTNNLHISRYIGVNESLPTSGIAEGTIYAKGPYYAEDDTLNDNPIYRLWVYAWKGDTLAWQDNGEFTSISAGVVQETGDSETEVMSQKAISDTFGHYEDNPEYIHVYTTVDNQVLFGIKKDGSIEWFKGIPLPIRNEIVKINNRLFIEKEQTNLEVKEMSSDISFLKSFILNENALPVANRMDENSIIKSYISIPSGIIEDNAVTSFCNYKIEDGGVTFYRTETSNQIRAIIGIPSSLRGFDLTLEGYYKSPDVDTRLTYGNFSSSAAGPAYLRKKTEYTQFTCDIPAEQKYNYIGIYNANELGLPLSVSFKDLSIKIKSLDKIITTGFQEEIDELEKYHPSVPEIVVDYSNVSIIDISNQSDFNNLSSNIDSILNSFTNGTIIVNINEGKYFIPKNMFPINNIGNRSNVNIVIRGIGDVIILGSNNEYKYSINDDGVKYEKTGYVLPHKMTRGSYKPLKSFITKNNEVIGLSNSAENTPNGIHYMTTLARDEGNGIWSFDVQGILEDMSEEDCIDTISVSVTSEWTNYLRPVNKIQGGRLYYNPALSSLNPNSDKTHYNTYPRWKVVNYAPSYNNIFIDKNNYIHIPYKYTELYECLHGSYITVNNNIKSLNITGIKFIGFSSGLGNAENSALIYLNDNTKIQLLDISNNEFIGINKVVTFGSSTLDSSTITSAGDVIFCNNTIKDVQALGVNVYARKALIRGNHFENCGLYSDSSSDALRINATSFMVSENEFKNCSHNSIRVNKHYSEGVIECNYIHQTDDYIIENKEKLFVCDDGLVYIQPDDDIIIDDKYVNPVKVVIRYNVIEGKDGFGANRGVFFDNGVGNVFIYGNIIGNIRNSYSLDRRYVNTGTLINSLCAYNIVDSDIRFVGDTSEQTITNYCLTNILLYQKNVPSVGNSNTINEDSSVINGKINSNNVEVSGTAIDKIKEIINNRFIINHLKRLN